MSMDHKTFSLTATIAAIDPATNALPAIAPPEDAASPVESGAAPESSGAKWTRVPSESCALRGRRV